MSLNVTVRQQTGTVNKLRQRWIDEKCDGDPPGGKMAEAQYPDFDWAEFRDLWWRAIKQNLTSSRSSRDPQIPFLPPMPVGMPAPVFVP